MYKGFKNLYKPFWISCKANAFFRYFRKTIIKTRAPKITKNESVTDNIQISLCSVEEFVGSSVSQTPNQKSD